MSGYGIGAAKGPLWKEIIPERGEHPPVRVAFTPAPSPMALRNARAAVGDVMRAAAAASISQADAIQRAGDAFTREILRHSIVDWSGLIDEATGDPIAPTHDIVVEDPDGGNAIVEPGTISAFLSDPRLVEAADREYVVPWTMRDAEKNGYAPSPNGTSEGATPAADTATLPAKPTETGDAGTTKPARRRARTKSTRAKPKKARASGS